MITVRGLVEVVGLDVRLDRGGERLAAEHHRAEQRLLGLQVVRRDPRPRRAGARRRRRRTPGLGPVRCRANEPRNPFPSPQRRRLAPRPCGLEEEQPCVFPVDNASAYPQPWGLWRSGAPKTWMGAPARVHPQGVDELVDEAGDNVPRAVWRQASAVTSTVTIAVTSGWRRTASSVDAELLERLVERDPAPVDLDPELGLHRVRDVGSR